MSSLCFLLSDIPCDCLWAGVIINYIHILQAQRTLKELDTLAVKLQQAQYPLIQRKSASCCFYKFPQIVIKHLQNIPFSHCFGNCIGKSLGSESLLKWAEQLSQSSNLLEVRIPSSDNYLFLQKRTSCSRILKQTIFFIDEYQKGSQAYAGLTVIAARDWTTGSVSQLDMLILLTKARQVCWAFIDLA